MSNNIINILLFLGAAQAILLCVLIFQKHRSLYANRFLAAMMLLFGIVLLNLLLSELGYYSNYPHFILVPLAIPFLIGPLHFLYAKYLIQCGKSFNKKDWLHFLPFIIYQLYLMPIFFKSSEEILFLMQYSDNNKLPLNLVLFNWTIILQGAVYIFLTLLSLKRYSRYIKDLFSSLEKIRLDWLRNITYMIGALLIIFLIENLFLLAGINLSGHFDLTSLLFAVYVYTLGYLGLLKSEIFIEPEIADSINHLTELSYSGRIDAEGKSNNDIIKYERSGLSQEKAKMFADQLLDMMKQEKLYTDNSLSLHKLAEKLSLSPHNLSEVINTQLHQNLFDFVNKFRVEKVKEDLKNSEKQNLTLLSIAFDAGFNSKSSFNAIFKKHTGETPSEYRKNI